MGRSLLFTNHTRVLSQIAQQPDLRLREIAREVGITERAAHRIITELVTEGYLTRTRVGSRNRYEVNLEALRGGTDGAGQTTTQVIALLGAGRAETLDPFTRCFAAAPAAMFVADSSGRLVAVNPAFCELLQRTEAELLGSDVRDLTHPDDVGADASGPGELASGRRAECPREQRYLLPTGAAIWVRVRSATTICPDTGANSFVAHVADITDCRRKDQALAEADERFRGWFDNAPIGMALVAPDGRWLKVNRALCELTGYPETALLVRSFQNLTHPDDLDADLALVQDVLADRRRTYQMEKRYYHAAGHLVWVRLSVSLVRDDRGTPLYFISQIEDITEARQRRESSTP